MDDTLHDLSIFFFNGETPVHDDSQMPCWMPGRKACAKSLIPEAAFSVSVVDPVARDVEKGVEWRAPGSLFFFFFTLVTGPRKSLSLKLSDARVYEPQIRARLGTAASGCTRITVHPTSAPQQRRSEVPRRARI